MGGQRVGGLRGFRSEVLYIKFIFKGKKKQEFELN